MTRRTQGGGRLAKWACHRCTGRGVRLRGGQIPSRHAGILRGETDPRISPQHLARFNRNIGAANRWGCHRSVENTVLGC